MWPFSGDKAKASAPKNRYDELVKLGCEEDYVPPQGGSDYTLTLEELRTFSYKQACSAAVEVAERFKYPRRYIWPSDVALRKVHGHNPAGYLFERFGKRLGWKSEADARAFYKRV